MAEVTINAADGGSFTAYVANQLKATGPGLLLIQEIFGVNQTMRDLADDLSLLGYVVVCPDLFWRLAPGIRLDNYDDSDWQKAFGYFKAFDTDHGVDDLKATLAQMRRMTEITGKIGTVGYGLGGKLAYLLMTRSDIDAGVSYYGVGIDTLLVEVGAIIRPYMAHVAGRDKSVPPAAQDAIREAFGRNRNISFNLFEDQDHAFARVGGDHWDSRAAGMANEMTADFFRQHLARQDA
jgi:carboxymethylenebutenolidase